MSLSVQGGSRTTLCAVWAYSDGTYRISDTDNGAGGFRQDTIPTCQQLVTALAMGV